jgi:Helix-turn-helix domain
MMRFRTCIRCGKVIAVCMCAVAFVTAFQWPNAPRAATPLALIAIAESHNDKSGDCYPSQRYIAEVIGLTERPTRARLNQLEADGFYTRKPRYDTRGKRTSDGYVLHFDRAEALPAEATAASDELVLTAEAATGSKTKSENSLPAVSELPPADTPVLISVPEE